MVASFALLASALLLCVALGGAPAESSIEKEPVRVTHRNSGPRYDIDEVERTRLNADASENQVIPSGPRGDPSVDSPSAAGSSEVKPPPAERPAGAAAGEEEPIGHISIRRIFLIPMSNPDWRPAQEGDSGRQQPGEQPEEANPLASLFGAAPSQHHRAAAPSFWPFLLRPSYHEQEPQQQQQQAHGHRHLFGADEASRPPPADTVASSESNEQASAPPRGGEREVDSALVDPRERPQRPQKPLLDPIQMMIEMMQQALNPSPMGAGAGASDGLGPNIFSDLNREASSGGAQRAGAGEESRFGADKPAGGELEASRPQLGKRNETREDVVEIDGKKYLRRTVTNKHVGDNIIFMTKRLIFTPLNETTVGGGEQTAPAAPVADEQPSIPSVGPLFVPTSAGNADVLPDIIKEEPERRKVDKVEGSPVEPANSSAAASPAAPSATPETTSVSSSETKPSNSETPAPVAAEPAATTEAPLSTTQAASTSPEETTQKSFVERVSTARAAERLIDQERPTPSSSTNMKPL